MCRRDLRAARGDVHRRVRGRPRGAHALPRRTLRLTRQRRHRVRRATGTPVLDRRKEGSGRRDEPTGAGAAPHVVEPRLADVRARASHAEWLTQVGTGRRDGPDRHRRPPPSLRRSRGSPPGLGEYHPATPSKQTPSVTLIRVRRRRTGMFRPPGTPRAPFARQPNGNTRACTCGTLVAEERDDGRMGFCGPLVRTGSRDPGDRDEELAGSSHVAD